MAIKLGRKEKKKNRLNSLVSKHKDWIYNKDKKSTTKQTIQPNMIINLTYIYIYRGKT